jgi:hypothetical protein
VLTRYETESAFGIGRKKERGVSARFLTSQQSPVQEEERINGRAGNRHGKICEHAQGSLLSFLDHQSEKGRIPIMLDVTDPDPFECLGAEAPKPSQSGQTNNGAIGPADC